MTRLTNRVLRSEAEYLQTIANTTDYAEQRRLAQELDRFRAWRKGRAERDRSIDLTAAKTSPGLKHTPTFAYTTEATDWILDLPTSVGNDYEHRMRAEASMWFKSVSEEVVEDEEEFFEQAKGQAQEQSGQFGSEASLAYNAYMEQARRLRDLKTQARAIKEANQVANRFRFAPWADAQYFDLDSDEFNEGGYKSIPGTSRLFDELSRFIPAMTEPDGRALTDFVYNISSDSMNRELAFAWAAEHHGWSYDDLYNSWLMQMGSRKTGFQVEDLPDIEGLEKNGDPSGVVRYSGSNWWVTVYRDEAVLYSAASGGLLDARRHDRTSEGIKDAVVQLRGVAEEKVGAWASRKKADGTHVYPARWHVVDSKTGATEGRQRAAIVRGGADDLKHVQAFLPDNYNATDILWWYGQQLDKIYPGSIFIVGEDYAGWTLDDYVIPRLASGLIFAEELPAGAPARKQAVNVIGEDDLSYKASRKTAGFGVFDEATEEGRLIAGPFDTREEAAEALRRVDFPFIFSEGPNTVVGDVFIKEAAQDPEDDPLEPQWDSDELDAGFGPIYEDEDDDIWSSSSRRKTASPRAVVQIGDNGGFRKRAWVDVGDGSFYTESELNPQHFYAVVTPFQNKYSWGVYHVDESTNDERERAHGVADDPETAKAEAKVALEDAAKMGTFSKKASGPDYAVCGACGLCWDDSIGTALTPAPAARCPFEYFHEYDDTGEPLELEMDDIPPDHPVQPVSDGFRTPTGQYLGALKTSAPWMPMDGDRVMVKNLGVGTVVGRGTGMGTFVVRFSDGSRVELGREELTRVGRKVAYDPELNALQQMFQNQIENMPAPQDRADTLPCPEHGVEAEKGTTYASFPSAYTEYHCPEGHTFRVRPGTTREEMTSEGSKTSALIYDPAEIDPDRMYALRDEANTVFYTGVWGEEAKVLMEREGLIAQEQSSGIFFEGGQS